MTLESRPGAIASDVGGTFTDIVGWDGATLVTGKVPSTPEDQGIGVVAGTKALGIDAEQLLHGTTVATNALLERSGARVGLVTTAGFEDVLEIGRQDRPSLYDSFVDRPEPLVPPQLRVGVDRAGSPTTADIASLDGKVDAVAISLLDGYRRSDDERHVADLVRKVVPGAYVTRSSAVAPEFREFERTSTTVLNAYLGPATSTYLSALRDRLASAGLTDRIAVMRSSGGLMQVDEAVELSAAMLLSGPAGGVIAAAAMGKALSVDRIISFDMGGTSSDVSRIEGGRPEVAFERAIGGYPCRLPSVAVHTVGAGGGSIAWVDPGGALRVGPQSAGAVPGPACYGLGGIDVTVTDANVVLGRLDPDAKLGGTVALDPDAALAAVARLAADLGLSTDASAEGIVAVVEEVMAGAIRRVTIEQGADPRGAHLVAFGGAGGLHAVALAQRLSMAGVIIPPHAGVFSALGLLLSAPRVDVTVGVHLTSDDEPRLHAEVVSVAKTAARRFERTSGAEAQVSTTADVRYVGQAHELSVAVNSQMRWTDLAERFAALHAVRNGFARADDPVEIVAVRAEATGAPTLRWDDIAGVAPVGDPDRGTRPVRTAGGIHDAAVWWRPGLGAGAEIVGPAIVEEPEATTYLPLGARGVVDESGAVAVEW